MISRCGNCSRRISVRWKKCPFCRRPTLVPWSPAYPYIDRSLNTFRAFGIGVFVWVLVGAAFIFLVDEPLGFAVAAGGIVCITVLAIAPLGLRAWVGSVMVWPPLALGTAALIGPRWSALGALVCLLPTAWMLSRYREVEARLLGKQTQRAVPKSEVPLPGPCTWCGSRQSELMAPLYVASAVAFTTRFPGKFVNVCDRHARLATAPAVVFSLVAGWWGIPWGPLWTTDALYRNLFEGGVTLDADVLHEWRQLEAQQGGLEDPTPLADFALGLVAGVVPFLLVGLTGRWAG